MTRPLSTSRKLALTATMLLGATFVAQAQKKLILEINDNMVARGDGPGAQYSVFDLAKPEHCIAQYDASAANAGKPSFVFAEQVTGAQVDTLKAAAASGHAARGIYKGSVQLGDCQIGGAPTSNYTAAANQTAAPAAPSIQSGQAAVAAGMNSAMNSVDISYKIMKADAQNATIEIYTASRTYEMKIEKGTTAKAAGSLLRGSIMNTNSGSLKTLNGKEIKLSIDGTLPRYYTSDGVPLERNEAVRGYGAVSTVMRMWNSNTLAKLGNDLIEQVKAKTGQEPEYANVARALVKKGVAAPPPGATGGSSEVVQPPPSVR